MLPEHQIFVKDRETLRVVITAHRTQNDDSGNGRLAIITAGVGVKT